MFQYAMKAAANSAQQLADRIDKFDRLELEPVIELFLAGFADVYDKKRETVKNCSRFAGCRYIVHFPLHGSETGSIYDGCTVTEKDLRLLLDFCEEIGSGELIMHRCYGFNGQFSKKEAEEGFLKKVILWDKLAKEKNVKILVENYGFVWLPEFLGKKYVVSPLDHFFPWDISRFNEEIVNLNLKNTGILLDVAHAALSSNMFNMLKSCPELNSDPRFSNIYPDDLERENMLGIKDFLFDFIDHFHISDSFIWQSKDGLADVKKYLYTENLPLGKGNVAYPEIFKNVEYKKTVIMEINPENGDHADNLSQLRAIELFRGFSVKGDNICA